MSITSIKALAAAGGAACVFIGGMAGFPLNFLGDLAVSLPLAGATGLGIWRFWPGNKTSAAGDIKALQASITGANTSGVDPKEVVEAITVGSEKLDKILRHAANIKAPNTVRRIQKIDRIGRQIIEDFRIDPKDVRIARSWLNTYLDETITLVSGYATLSSGQAVRSFEVQKQLAQFDDMLDLIEKKFQELLEKLLNNDATDFDVNMTVMRNMLNQEGI
jgi:5-bromo-4-chloroindolyl phosphate hydrolysis protein